MAGGWKLTSIKKKATTKRWATTVIMVDERDCLFSEETRVMIVGNKS